MGKDYLNYLHIKIHFLSMRLDISDNIKVGNALETISYIL